MSAQPKQSTVDGMTVLEVRSAMDIVRSAHQDGTLRLGQCVGRNMSAVEFCARMALGRHMKRRRS